MLYCLAYVSTYVRILYVLDIMYWILLIWDRIECEKQNLKNTINFTSDNWGNFSIL